MAWRLRGRYGYPQDRPFKVTEHVDRLYKPFTWKKPRLVFVDSMSDLFHREVSDEFRAAVFGVMAATPQHTYQVLTKRPRLAYHFFQWVEGEVELKTAENPVRVCQEYAFRKDARLPRYHESAWKPGSIWPLPNVWVIASCEDQEALNERTPTLLDLPAAVRGVSLEPLLDLVTVRSWLGVSTAFDSITMKRYPRPPLDWVILGCESGPKRRRFDWNWARVVRDECKDYGVPFYFKQAPHPNAREIWEIPALDGETWEQYPRGYVRETLER